MKFGVITFPGSNCDMDLIRTLRDQAGQKVVHLWHKDTDLQGCDMVFLPGGFSYGDYLRGGAIARFSPIMKEVIRHARKGGYVMGICNGFQILAEAGLVPGVLMRNKNTSFICRNVFITPASRAAILTSNLGKAAYKVPIAHAEGNYYCDQDTLKRIQDQGQILFQYCNAHGEVTPEANPNGSLLNIAGVCNEEKNVFGMMPHPERAADPLLANLDGKLILDNLYA